MRLINDAGVTTISHDGETHTPLEGCDVFEVPGELGRHLLAFPALGWREADDDLEADDEPKTTPRRRSGRRKTTTTD